MSSFVPNLVCYQCPMYQDPTKGCDLDGMACLKVKEWNQLFDELQAENKALRSAVRSLRARLAVADADRYARRGTRA